MEAFSDDSGSISSPQDLSQSYHNNSVISLKNWNRDFTDQRFLAKRIAGLQPSILTEFQKNGHSRFLVPSELQATIKQINQVSGPFLNYIQ